MTLSVQTGQKGVKFAFQLSVIAATCSFAMGEEVYVKYRGPVILDTFECQDISTGSFIKRICYDAEDDNLIVKLNDTYYHYCEVDEMTVRSLMSASSIGTFYNNRIRGNGIDGPFDCRTHQFPSG